ncbi:MAG: hypothetical protein NTX86_04270 [Candidatus Dependentiae bacterium]|nr:hypothetical protein [Candidatus Dependentiae bacterium]
MADIRLKRLLVVGLCLNLYSVTTRAGIITLHNKTDRDVFVSMYRSASSEKSGVHANGQSVIPIMIKKEGFVDIERPADDRVLGFSFIEKDLGSSIEADTFAKLAHVPVHLVSGDSLYFAVDGPELKGYDTVEYEVVLPAIAKLSNVKNQIKQVVTSSIAEYMKPLSQYVKKTSKAVQQNPHKDEVAQVRIGNELCMEEKAYLEKRMPNVKTALEKLLGRSVNSKNVPNIALVESGGGYRAMLCSIGWHLGITKLGVMDVVTYMVGLSGSTWSIGSWVASGLSIERFKEQLIPKTEQGIYSLSVPELMLLAGNLLVKAAYDQELTIIDLYGALLANALLKDFGDDRQKIYLSQQAKTIEGGDWPFPIYTAVRADEHAKQDWYEFTPYEIGATWIATDKRGMYIPSWAYGRTFFAGKSIDFAPEQSLGFQKGTFGAAIAGSVEEAIQKITESKKVLPPFDQVMDVMINTLGSQRITTAVANNFSFGMEASTIKDLKQLRLADGATEFNLPYPPVSGERPERKADILIFVDFADDSPTDFKRVEKYARDKGLKFPAIDYAAIENRVLTVFKDEHDAYSSFSNLHAVGE